MIGDDPPGAIRLTSAEGEACVTPRGELARELLLVERECCEVRRNLASPRCGLVRPVTIDDMRRIITIGNCPQHDEIVVGRNGARARSSRGSGWQMAALDETEDLHPRR